MDGLNRNWRHGLLPAVENRRGRPFFSTAVPLAKEFHGQHLARYFGENPNPFWCLACGRAGGASEFELDHRIPRSLGGPNTLENSEILCVSCNRKKKDQAWRTFLSMTRSQNFLARVDKYYAWLAEEVKKSGSPAYVLDLQLEIGIRKGRSRTNDHVVTPASTFVVVRGLKVAN